MAEHSSLFVAFVLFGSIVAGCGARSLHGGGGAGGSDPGPDAGADAGGDSGAECGPILLSGCLAPAPDESVDLHCEDVAPCAADGDCVVMTADPCCRTIRAAVRVDRQDEVTARLGACEGGPTVCPSCPQRPVHAQCVAESCVLVDGDAPTACGGWGGQACGVTGFCDFEGDYCDWTDASGVCRPRPRGCRATFEPVCGCDGQTYSNLCTAQSAGVDAAYAGQCGDG